jgi:hypothetical protein
MARVSATGEDREASVARMGEALSARRRAGRLVSATETQMDALADVRDSLEAIAPLCTPPADRRHEDAQPDSESAFKEREIVDSPGNAPLAYAPLMGGIWSGRYVAER